MAVATTPDALPRPTNPPVCFLVVVPTIGRGALLDSLLTALAAQTFPRHRWTLLLSFDGAAPTGAIARRLEGMEAMTVTSPERRGPGAARNLGARSSAARAATGDYLAFTEDDCTPAPDWLALAAARLDREPAIDVLEGATLLPDGRPARRRYGDRPTWLPTNLFVRRIFFESVGGYCERFFNPRGAIYFREDSDFGFTVREAGARVAIEPTSRVTHPREHQDWLDPIRWARRYEMDPLLRARHPRAFREEIEVVRSGPFRLRRPFVRACAGYIMAIAAALAALLIGEAGVAAWFGGVAAALVLVMWGKWRFEPARILIMPIVPIVLIAALVRGRRRAALHERDARGEPA